MLSGAGVPASSARQAGRPCVCRMVRAAGAGADQQPSPGRGWAGDVCSVVAERCPRARISTISPKVMCESRPGDAVCCSSLLLTRQQGKENSVPSPWQALDASGASGACDVGRAGYDWRSTVSSCTVLRARKTQSGARSGSERKMRQAVSPALFFASLSALSVPGACRQAG